MPKAPPVKRNPQPPLQPPSNTVERARSVIESYNFPSQTTFNGKRVPLDPGTEKRFLLAVLDFGLEPPAIAREILENAGALERLSVYIWRRLFIPFRAAGGQTPRSTPHPSRPDTPSPESESEIEELLELSPAKRDQNVLRRAIGDRDNFRCLATDCPETKHATVMSHIIPYFCGNNTAFLTALDRFSPKLAVGRLVAGANVNKPYNALTLSHGIGHEAFSKWSFVIDVDDHGILRMKQFGEHSCFLRRLFSDGTSVSIDNQMIESSRTPNERAINLDLLRIHAALGRVLHASGRAEELDLTVERDYEEGLDLEAVNEKLTALEPPKAVEE